MSPVEHADSPIDLRRAPLAALRDVDLRATRARLLGGRGGALGSTRRDVGRTRRRGMAPARRGAVRRGRAGLVARRARRPSRGLAGARRSTTPRPRSRPAAGRPTTTTTAATSTGSTSGCASPWAIACRATRSSPGWRPRRRRAPRGGRDPLADGHPRRRGLGLGLHRAPRPLPGPPRGHRAVGRRAARPPGRRRPVRRRPADRRPRHVHGAATQPSPRDLDALLATVPLDRWDAARSRPAGRCATTSPTWPTGPRRASGRSRSSAATATGWPTPTRASTPGTSGWSSAAARRRRVTDARAIRARPRGRCAMPSTTLDDRDAALARRLELGLRLPVRARPQAPGDAGPVVRGRGLAGRRRADAADRRSAADDRAHDRGRSSRSTRRASSASTRVTASSRTRRRRAARASCSRCRSGAGRRPSSPRRRRRSSEPAVVAGRPAARLHPRRGALGRRGRWLAVDPGRGQARAARASRTGRPTASASRSSRGAVAGRRSGSSTRRCRAAAARPTSPGCRSRRW